MTRRFVAVLVALAVALIARVAPSVDAATGPSTTAAYAYDGGANSSTLSGDPAVHRASDGTSSNDPATSATDDFSLSRAVVVAAKTVGTAIESSELSAGQASNYARYVKKLPSGAQDPVITRGANGSVQFSADVPGRVPGSYATYTKIVDSSGTTTDYYKTTVAPDGSIVHVKIKFP